MLGGGLGVLGRAGQGGECEGEDTGLRHRNCMTSSGVDRMQDAGRMC